MVGYLDQDPDQGRATDHLRVGSKYHQIKIFASHQNDFDPPHTHF